MQAIQPATAIDINSIHRNRDPTSIHRDYCAPRAPVAKVNDLTYYLTVSRFREYLCCPVERTIRLLPAESWVLPTGPLSLGLNNLLVKTLTELVSQLKELNKQVENQVGFHQTRFERTEIHYLRQLLEKCDICSGVRRESCQSNPPPCFQGVACQDTREGVRCGHCPRGYVGDGRTCTPGTTCEEKPCFPDTNHPFSNHSRRYKSIGTTMTLSRREALSTSICIINECDGVTDTLLIDSKVIRDSNSSDTGGKRVQGQGLKLFTRCSRSRFEVIHKVNICIGPCGQANYSCVVSSRCSRSRFEMIHKVFSAMTPWKASDAGPVPRVWWATEDNVRRLVDVIATPVIVRWPFISEKKQMTAHKFNCGKRLETVNYTFLTVTKDCLMPSKQILKFKTYPDLSPASVGHPDITDMKCIIWNNDFTAHPNTPSPEPGYGWEAINGYYVPNITDMTPAP
uniref:Uncharacterized protein n=1 Tax=Timema douglasi TaxID=61478 RepID=A0A7R8VTC9_TIMDO|nr:unnamed protein product [Timema douglasi]